MYILDTNVISELRKGKKAEQRVRMWAQALPAANLYLSVVSVLELEIGALLVERRDRKQGAILRLDRWSCFTFILRANSGDRYRCGPAMRIAPFAKSLLRSGSVSSQPLRSFMA